MKDSSIEESKTKEHYKFTVSYNGSAYFGFQIQGKQKTVQLEIENALRQLGWEENSIIGAGRTDTGVHARAQVFSASLAWSHGIQSLISAMNAKLPKDIAVSNIETVQENFHARFDAKSRCYHYRIYYSEMRDPIRDPLYWRVSTPLNLGKLNEISKRFIGIHDFKAFGSPPRKDRGTTREVIESFWVALSEDEAEYVIRANAFLYHMVRRIVYAQVAYQNGRFTEKEIINAIQDAKPLKPGLAPPNGLRLWEVTY